MALWLAYTPVVAAGDPALETAAQTPADMPQYVLTPIESTAIELQAHTVDYRLFITAEGQLQLAVNAQYRLFNPGAEAITQLVQLRNVAPANGAPNPPPADLALLLDEQLLSLQPAADASYTTLIGLAADGRSTVRVQYTLLLAEQALPLLRYSVAHMPQWPGAASLRVTITLPESLSADQWLRIEPAGWTFTPSDNAREPAVQWLREPGFPEQTFVLQFINPAVNAQLRAAQQTAQSAPSAATRGEVARLYQQIYSDPAINNTGDSGEIGVRERFYAQALAAYLDGIDSAPGGGSAEVGALHAGLAALYRSRVVGGAQDEQYVSLMVAEIDRALDTLAPDARQRPELLRWRLEGLYTLFQQARNRQDWSGALTLLDQLQSQLSTGAAADGRLTAADLESERQAIRVQQALAVLAKGETDAAIALAGPDIQNAALAPAPDLQSLFANWQISSTLTAESTTVDVLAFPAAGQAAAARNALQNIITRWQTVSTDHTIQLDDEPNPASNEPLHFRIASTANTSHLPLVQALPDNANWALLRALLTQLNPAIESSGLFLRRHTEMSQPLDLRSVGDHWNALAANLSQQATAFEAEATRLSGEGIAKDGAALQAQIQGVNYHNAAQVWRALLRNSRVTVILQAGGGSPTARAWLTTVDAPPQLFKLQAQTINPLRLLGLVLAVVLVILGLSGLLWWLL
ncbi:MAG: hypothetical protein R2911_13325 [Caldilineaceae bacterium]